MRAGRSALKRVIDSVADGSGDIDWERLEQESHSERDLELFRQLRVVAQLSNLQREEIERGDERPLLASVEAIERLRTKSMASRADTVEPPRCERGGQSPTLPTRVWGRLKLFERLGEGTFGEVYRAFDPQLERDVAVKLLHVGKRSAEKRCSTRRARSPAFITRTSSSCTTPRRMTGGWASAWSSSAARRSRAS